MEIRKPEIPEKVNQFNVYDRGLSLIGVSGEVELPTISMVTSTLDGPGILGEIESPTLGKFQSMPQTIPFRTLYYSAINMFSNFGNIDLTLRGSIQTLSREGSMSFTPVRLVFRGRTTEFNLGKVKQGEATDSTVKAELTYFLCEIGNIKCLEIDKLNGIFKVYGVDQLAGIKAMC